MCVVRQGPGFILLHVNIQLSLLPWFGRLFLPPASYFDTLVKNQLTVIVRTYFWTLSSIPFDLYYVYPYASFEIRKCESSSSVVFFQIVLAVPDTQQIPPTRLLSGHLLPCFLEGPASLWEPGWSAELGWKSLSLPFSLPFRRHLASRDWAVLAELS